MNKSRFARAVAGFSFIVVLAGNYVAHGESAALKPEVALRQAFPNLPFETIGQTDINGLYEVISGQNVFYFYPEKEYLFFGEIVAKDGKSITAAKKGELAANLVKNLPLNKAVKVGSGATAVIEFTDPDCPYCKKAHEFFKNRTDVTSYVFFTPLAHPAAITKIHYILNAEDKAKAYHEMMEGGKPVQPAAGYSESVKKLAQEHIALARSAGVTGTPTFFISGKQVVGADIQQIEKLLKQAASVNK